MSSIQPFRSQEAGKAWIETNCHRCKFAHLGNSHASIEDLERQVAEGTECRLKMAVMLAKDAKQLMDSSVAYQIGYNTLYGFATRCKAQRPREKSQGATGNNPAKAEKPEPIANQLNLF